MKMFEQIIGVLSLVIIISFLVGAGYVTAQNEIADKCKDLTAFKIREQTFRCYTVTKTYRGKYEERGLKGIQRNSKTHGKNPGSQGV